MVTTYFMRSSAFWSENWSAILYVQVHESCGGWPMKEGAEAQGVLLRVRVQGLLELL